MTHLLAMATEAGAYPVVATHTMDQIAVSAVCVWILQLVKKAKWIPFIQQNTATVNRLAAMGLAAISAAGLHITFDRGDGTLVITGLTLTGLVTAAWTWAKAYAVQEVIYQGAVNKPGMPQPTGV